MHESEKLGKKTVCENVNSGYLYDMELRMVCSLKKESLYIFQAFYDDIVLLPHMHFF